MLDIVQRSRRKTRQKRKDVFVRKKNILAFPSLLPASHLLRCGSTSKIENDILKITLTKMKFEEPAKNIDPIIFDMYS
jgi:hypothetical protein